MAQVKAGDTVRIHYTGTLDDGEVFDSSEGREPLTFTVGAGQVIPGFDDAVLGMNVGDEKTVTIPAERAYGEHQDSLLMEVPRADLPADREPQVGDQLMIGTPDGQPFPVTIYALSDDSAVLDSNHPLAGEDLTFDIALVEILSDEDAAAFQQQVAAQAPQVQRIEVPKDQFEGAQLPAVGEQITLNTPDGSFPAIVVEIRDDVVVLDVLAAPPPVRRVEIPKDQLTGGPPPQVGQNLTLNTPEGQFPATVVEIRDDVYVVDMLMAPPPVQRITVPKEQLPPELNPQVGEQLMMNGPDGQTFPAQVVEVTPDGVVMDILLVPVDPSQLPPQPPQGSGLLGPDGKPIGGGAKPGERTSPGGLILP